MGSSIADSCDLEAAETDTSCFHKNWPGIFSTVAWAVSEKPDIMIDLRVGLWKGSRSGRELMTSVGRVSCRQLLGKTFFMVSMLITSYWLCVVLCTAPCSTISHWLAVHLIYGRASLGSIQHQRRLENVVPSLQKSDVIAV